MANSRPPKSKASEDGLRGEDRTLWRQVTSTVTPLEKTDHPESEPPGKSKKAVAERPARIAKPVPDKQVVRRSRPAPAQLDDKTTRAIARGRAPIDGRIDLHGLTQARAHQMLIARLEAGHRAGERIILVITGKGDRGEGVLRRAVPRWLAAPPLNALVSGYRRAHVGHGGDGALYVRIRRRNR